MMNRLLFLSGILLASLMMASLANGMQGNVAKSDDSGGAQHPLAEAGQDKSDEGDEQVTLTVASDGVPKDIIASVSDGEQSDATTRSSVAGGDTNKAKKRKGTRKNAAMDDKSKKTVTSRKPVSKATKRKDDVLESGEVGGSDSEEDQGSQESLPIDSSAAHSVGIKETDVEPPVRVLRQRIVVKSKKKSVKSRKAEDKHKLKTSVKDGDSESESDKKENDQKGDQKTGVGEESGASETESEADKLAVEENQHEKDVGSTGDNSESTANSNSKKATEDEVSRQDFPEEVFLIGDGKKIAHSDREKVKGLFDKFYESKSNMENVLGWEVVDKTPEEIAGFVIESFLLEKKKRQQAKQIVKQADTQIVKQATKQPAKQPAKQPVAAASDESVEGSSLVSPNDEEGTNNKADKAISLPELSKPYYPAGENVDVGWMTWFLSAPAKLQKALAHRIFSHVPSFTQKISVAGRKSKNNSYLPDLDNPGRFYIVNPKGEMGKQREGNLVIQLDVISEGTEEQRDERLKQVDAIFYLVPEKRQRRPVIDPAKHLVMTMTVDFSSFNAEGGVVNPEVVITLAEPVGVQSASQTLKKTIRVPIGDNDLASDLAVGNDIHRLVLNNPGSETQYSPYVLRSGMSSSLGQEQGVYVWLTPEELAVLFDKRTAFKKKLLTSKKEGKRSTKKRRKDQDPEEELVNQFDKEVEEQIQGLFVIASVDRDKEAEIFIKDDEEPPENWMPAEISMSSWPLEL